MTDAEIHALAVDILSFAINSVSDLEEDGDVLSEIRFGENNEPVFQQPVVFKVHCLGALMAQKSFSAG